MSAATRARGSIACACLALAASAACRSVASRTGADADAEVTTVPIASATAPSIAPSTTTDTAPLEVDGGVRLRDVDWANYTYPGAWGGQLHDGRAESHLYERLGAPHDTIVVKLVTVAYGDVDGDGRDDAVVALSETDIPANGPRDPSTSGHLYVYAVRNGRLTKIGWGTTQAPSAVRIERRRVLVDTSWSWQRVVQERCQEELVLEEQRLVERGRRCSDAGAP